MGGGLPRGSSAPAETARFERALLTPEVAEAFREALVLRELLASMPPDAPPEALIDRLEEALELDVVGERKRKRRDRRRFPRIAAALDGASWAVRGPALAFAPAGDAVSSTRDAMSVSQTAMRGAFAPVNNLVPNAGARLRPKGEDRPLKPSWWRRALRLGRRMNRKKK